MLDAKSRFELQQLLVKLWGAEACRKTVVFVTHDLNEALLLADRIAFMRPRRIERIVDVPFSRPRDWESLAMTESFRSLRAELLDLFYLDGEEECCER